MKTRITFLFIFLLTFALNAQENIVVNTNTTQMVLKVDEDKNVKFEYFGKQLNALDDLFKANSNLDADAYPAFGIRPDRIMAIRVKHANDDRTLVLKYQSHDMVTVDDNVSLLTIHLKDEIYPFYVDLKYKAYKAEDVIEIWSEIHHTEKKSVTLYDYASACLPINARAPHITHFHGSWAGEFMMEETELDHGTFTIENTEGIRGSLGDNASFILSLNQASSEDDGEVIAGALAWSGNYKISFSRDRYAPTILKAGINNYASDYILEKGEKFTTPALALTYCVEGKGQASRNLHRYARNYKLIDGKMERKILLNSWEGVYLDFDEEKIVELIDDIANIGGELFVLDDGWFGNKYVRDKADRGLGDWEVSERKLPSGLKYLIDESEKRGIKFGIWLEPEMANVESELYEKHPEWVLQNTNRELVKGRGKTQVVLDLTNPEVQQFIFDTLNDLLVKNPRIDYIKWDANMEIANYGSTYLSKEKQSNLYIDYHLGLQQVLKRLRQKHPHTTMQACASGGGRVNYAYLPYFHEFWASDNTDALQRIYTQWGMSHVYPAITMASHVSASPNHQTGRIIPIKFRFDVAMTGRLGLEMQPKNMTDEEKNFSAEAIKTYKEIRPIVQFGDLYRLLSPFDNDHLSSLMYVDEQKQNAVYFAYYVEKMAREKLPPFKLKGLDPNKRYRITEINKFDDKTHFKGDGEIYTGEFLMETGIKIDFAKEYDSAVFQLNQM